MISVEALSRNYGDFQAVKNVSFQIRPGEIVGLLGHNGAGKTTIMKMLTGYLEPSGGQIQINGLDLKAHASALLKDIGYLPENPPTYPEMSVCDYLDYAAQLRGVPTAKRVQAVRDAIRKTELEDKALQPINTLSRGYRQRVGVAQAIVHSPKILIMDEPTNGLDPSQIQHMRELIKSLRQHATVILSTHIMQEVNAVCDRVLMIRHGELALDSSLAALQQSHRVRLHTNANASLLRDQLKNLGGLGRIEPLPATPGSQSDGFHFLIETQPGHESPHSSTSMQQTCAAIAKAVIESGCDLYALAPEVRDLDTLFREINQVKTEVAHAA